VLPIPSRDAITAGRQVTPHRGTDRAAGGLFGAVRLGGRPGEVHGVDGRGELQDLAGQVEQLLVLLLLLLDGLPLVVGQHLACL
jgi:hypothetical protein